MTVPTPDMVRETRRYADELCSCAKQGTRPMRIERFHVHRPIPSRAHDLREPLGIVLIGLVHLHLERGARMPCIKADDIEASAAQLMHKPRRHRASLQPNTRLLSRMPSYGSLDLLRFRWALAPPQPETGLIDDAN